MPSYITCMMAKQVSSPASAAQRDARAVKPKDQKISREALPEPARVYNKQARLHYETLSVGFKGGVPDLIIARKQLTHRACMAMSKGCATAVPIKSALLRGPMG